MSKKDTLTKKYLSQNTVFADAFNYYLFNGKQVIKPGDLKAQDPTEIAVIQKYGKIFPSQKMRDILRLCTIKHSKYATLVLLGIEAQAHVHYAMPVRDYLYDALNYAAQVESIQKHHMQANDLKDGAEFLSGFTKKDRLIPVITLCICFDKTKWDGPRSLYEMFGKVDPRIRQYVDDYRLNLITPSEIPDFTKFASQLGIVLEMIQNADDKKRMRAIIETRKEYQSVDVDTVNLINTYTTVKISTDEVDGGKINMGNAIQEMIEDGRKEGRTEGRKEGRAEERKEMSKAIADEIKKLRASGMPADQILQKIERDANRNARTRKKG